MAKGRREDRPCRHGETTRPRIGRPSRPANGGTTGCLQNHHGRVRPANGRNAPMSTIAELELASAQFDPMIEAATDPAVIKELQAAQFLVDSAIMDKINAGEKYTPPRKESTTQAKSEGK